MKLVYNKDRSKFYELSEDSKIADGSDGIIFRFGDTIVKLCCNRNVDRTMFETLLGLSNQSSYRLVLPREELINDDMVPTTICYSQPYVNQNTSGIKNFSIGKFLDEGFYLHSDVRTFFTANGIALRDHNPQNILVRDDDSFALIDHDRCFDWKKRDFSTTNGFDLDKWNSSYVANALYQMLRALIRKRVYNSRIDLDEEQLHELLRSSFNPDFSMYELLCYAEKYKTVEELIDCETKKLKR